MAQLHRKQLQLFPRNYIGCLTPSPIVYHARGFCPRCQDQFVVRIVLTIGGCHGFPVSVDTFSSDIYQVYPLFREDAIVFIRRVRQNMPEANIRCGTSGQESLFFLFSDDGYIDGRFKAFYWIACQSSGHACDSWRRYRSTLLGWICGAWRQVNLQLLRAFLMRSSCNKPDCMKVKKVSNKGAWQEKYRKWKEGGG